MLVRKQMLLTVLQIAPALAAVAEGQLRIGNLGATTDSTFVLGNAGSRSRLPKLCLKLLLTLLVLSCNVDAGEPEKQEHIGDGDDQLGAGHKSKDDSYFRSISSNGFGKSADDLIAEIHQFKYQHPFHLNGQYKKQKYLSLRHTHGQCQQHGQENIIGTQIDVSACPCNKKTCKINQNPRQIAQNNSAKQIDIHAEGSQEGL